MDFHNQVSALDALAGVAADALVLVVVGEALDPTLDKTVAGLVSEAVASGDFKFKAGNTLYLHRPAGLKAARLVVAAAANATPKAFKKAASAALAQLKGLGARHVAVSAPFALTAEHAEALVTAAADATYLYRHTKPSANADAVIAKVTLLYTKADAKAVKQGLARGQAVADGVKLARELGNRPGNYCTPTVLAEQAKKLGKSHGLKVEVLDRKAIEKLGMGSFLAVAQGSNEPPRFIVARYDGAAKGVAPVVLVGKGITFDSGGISLKPGLEMDEMKFDMSGAASVLGTMKAVAEMKLPLNVVAVIPATENMPGGAASKPGDVVTSMSGQTIEILNTDAEGRLILCDALTYVERFDPVCVVDIATLTGACVIALGHIATGLLANNDSLAKELLDAGQEAYDRAWQLPLWEDYQELLQSNFADMANIGGRAGGTITAAAFLSRFSKKFDWAHLDIAGTAYRSGKEKGSTGRPVPLLTHFLIGRAEAAES
jgi:leucyl aminopeptidase